MRRGNLYIAAALIFSAGALAFAADVRAQDVKAVAGSLADLRVAADTMWVMVAGFLVFWMHAGFAMLESGLCRAKNAVAILYKNFGVVAVSSLAFWMLGFALMFGDGGAIFGANGFFLSGADNSPATGELYKGVFSSLNWTGVPLYAKFFFQLVFAATAATIVSGCVAERVKFSSFMLFSAIPCISSPGIHVSRTGSAASEKPLATALFPLSAISHRRGCARNPAMILVCPKSRLPRRLHFNLSSGCPFVMCPMM